MQKSKLAITKAHTFRTVIEPKQPKKLQFHFYFPLLSQLWTSMLVNSFVDLFRFCLSKGEHLAHLGSIWKCPFCAINSCLYPILCRTLKETILIVIILADFRKRLSAKCPCPNLAGLEVYWVTKLEHLPRIWWCLFTNIGYCWSGCPCQCWWNDLWGSLLFQNIACHQKHWYFSTR